MRTRAAFLGGLSRLTLVATLLAIPAPSGHATAQPKDVIDVNGTVQDDAQPSLQGLHILCFAKYVNMPHQWSSSDAEAKFVIYNMPRNAKIRPCWISKIDTTP